MDWDITSEDKYQRISTYQCSIWPSLAINSILVILVIFLAFAYLLILVVTTIRKKKENQTSIMLRIMTNYLQLIAATYSFNIKFPDSMINAFGSVEIFGSSSNSYLSFDWFIEDTDIKGFAPSNQVFKVFLTFFIPIILLIVFCLIWLIL